MENPFTTIGVIFTATHLKLCGHDKDDAAFCMGLNESGEEIGGFNWNKSKKVYELLNAKRESIMYIRKDSYPMLHGVISAMYKVVIVCIIKGFADFDPDDCSVTVDMRINKELINMH